MEGQAYAPEAMEHKWEADLDKPAVVDGEQSSEYLHGRVPGSTILAQKRQDELYELIEPGKKRYRSFHGAGSRYIDDGEGAPLVHRCYKFIPESGKAPYNVGVSSKSRSELFIGIF